MIEENHRSILKDNASKDVARNYRFFARQGEDLKLQLPSYPHSKTRTAPLPLCPEPSLPAPPRDAKRAIESFIFSRPEFHMRHLPLLRQRVRPPFEVWREIFFYVQDVFCRRWRGPNYADLSACLRVCKTWEPAASEVLWDYIILSSATAFRRSWTPAALAPPACMDFEEDLFVDFVKDSLFRSVQSLPVQSNWGRLDVPPSGPTIRFLCALLGSCPRLKLLSTCLPCVASHRTLPHDDCKSWGKNHQVASHQDRVPDRVDPKIFYRALIATVGVIFEDFVVLGPKSTFEGAVPLAR
ncbi:hypothetical protein BDK51DRAFT_31592 [Blyttiomyces helicus]|uniref:F-box domain-containing protein n=1 Tax=Blyttiomyces helicus TaxID=388810 RepID=A0A4P9WNK6_9FUNG|nr:hypothetical protein BDK51DRAFT_31592 [Blyttiomyces helicus]|eukprot:RKO92780.1 hypothetical protein BDK51DRAFT_31592 [Blyttiomyces helicus]